MKWRDAGSNALLIPGVWLGIQGSRPVSYWFSPETATAGHDAEGNPINTLMFAVLIFTAFVILVRRGLNWGGVMGRNKALLLIYLFFAVSCCWSGAPMTSLKRLFKDLGCVLMALVVLTEENPAIAIRALFVRVACVLFTLSLVFGKYFPEIGRNYSSDGILMFTGVTTQKNSLGGMLCVIGLVVLWDLIETSKEKGRPGLRSQQCFLLGLLLLGLWLLIKCDSQTSLLCLLLGSFVLWAGQRLVTMQHGKRLLIACLSVAICFAALDKTFGLSEIVIRAVGRNPNLTGRSDIWRLVLAQQDSPVLGNGFYAFWDSNKGRAVVESFMQINSTHNGYLEMYMDGGLVAVALLAMVLLTGCGRVINRMFSGAPLGMLGMAVWATAVIYNLSESSFFRLDALWFTLLLLLLEYPAPVPVPCEVEAPPEQATQAA